MNVTQHETWNVKRRAVPFCLALALLPLLVIVAVMWGVCKGWDVGCHKRYVLEER